jgi:alpha-N-arabinofuranosidase
VNLDPNREALVTTRINGSTATGAIGRVLTSKVMDAHNTPDAPDVVAPVKISATHAKDGIVLRLPAKSLTVVRVQ